MGQDRESKAPRLTQTKLCCEKVPGSLFDLRVTGTFQCGVFNARAAGDRGFFAPSSEECVLVGLVSLIEFHDRGGVKACLTLRL